MPGSRGVCFVCGSLGADLPLHSKPRELGSYFPFLEHHEPPKGCRLPGSDGVVDSCRVCYAFLTQQWETYERSKTPAIKRLYWLKRSDDLTFTGAEMKLQGEYMAQVMGLQYQPNCHDNCSTAILSPDGHSVASTSYISSASAIRDSVGYCGTNASQDNGSYTNVVTRDNGGGIGITINVSRPSSRHNAVVNAQMTMRMYPSEPEGALDLSVTSKSGTVTGNENTDVTSLLNRGSNTAASRDSIACFTCTCEMHSMSSKVVSSVFVSKTEPWFPFLEKITPPKGAVPLSSQGLTRVCEICFTSLYQQWLSYERACTPSTARIYKVKDRYIDVSRIGNPVSTAELETKLKVQVRADEVCYLCGQVRLHQHICLLYTVPPGDRKHQMYFPFIRELRRPQGAQPLNPDGTVLVCSACHSNLQTQWQQYEAESVPLLHRRYSLLPVNPITSGRSLELKYDTFRTESPRGRQYRQKSADRPLEAFDVTQPLNIQISKSPVLASSTSVHGLLAIAPQTPRSISGDASNCSNPGSVMPELAASGSNPKIPDLPRGTNQSGNAGVTLTTVPHPLQQATSLPKKVCFLCGEKSLVSKAHLLFSYPVRHEAKTAGNSQSVPFFPFLARQESASGSDLMTEEGTVIACNFCYFSLLSQWKDYEDSKKPADSNRWLRKYSVRDFVCYVCGWMVSRCKIRSLEVAKFLFLKEHKAPNNALVLDAGEAVAVCTSCTHSLMHQYAEYERMGVPLELRKYNWTTAPMLDEVPDNFDQSGDDRGRKNNPPGNEDSNLSIAEAAPEVEDFSNGLAQGSKPPHLSMLSPSSGKMTPKTATVPPLSQASPSNGLTTGGANSALNATRTSSFAAALRKLAHQAKDPQEEAVTKHSSSPINSSSPRAATPKRAPPPLVYSSHSASLTSPPVVTIAPTQSISLNTDGRQSADRIPSAHSTASSYDHYSVKHDRDHRPHSSHSRDEDRSSVKDGGSLSQTPTRMVPPQSLSASSRDEGLVRGFHPYRPDEELHRAAAAAAAAAALPPPFGLDPAYTYHPAFLQPHPYSHPAFRFEDPLLERYRLMQATPFLPFVPHPSMHPLLSGSRYPPELLHQYQYISPNAQGLDHRSPQVAAERSRTDDERIKELEREKEREKEKREREKERDKEREVETVKREKLHEIEREREKQRSVEPNERRDILTVPSRYRNDHSNSGSGSNRENSQDTHSQYHHHHHHHHRSREESNGKVGSYGHSIHHDLERSRLSSVSDVGMDKNHLTSNSTRNNYHKKQYENHVLPKQETAVDTTRVAYRLNSQHREAEQAKSHSAPYLTSSHHSTSKSTGESSIFRPFEKDCPSQPAATGSLPFNDKVQEVPCVELTNTGKELCKDANGVIVGDKDDLSNSNSQLTSVVKIFGSTPEAKILNSSFITHRVERFDFKSLARECTSTSTLETSKSVSCDGIPNLTAPSVPQSHSVIPHISPQLLSKLDVKERRLREARANGTYNSESENESDSEAEEDRKRERLTVVKIGLPLELDATPHKVQLMDALGLATHQKKKEDTIRLSLVEYAGAVNIFSFRSIKLDKHSLSHNMPIEFQYKKFRKRRKLMRERSISPIELEDEGEETMDTSIKFCTSRIDPYLLCQEMDYKEKCNFLRSLEIMPLSPEQRKELEIIRQACERCKYRRLEKRKSSTSYKRISLNVTVNGLTTAPCVKRKFQHNEMENSQDYSIHPLRITLGQLQEHHMVASRQQQCKVKSVQINHLHSKTSNTIGVDGSRAVIFPETRDRQSSREFAEQFHESVLQSIRQKDFQKKVHNGDNGLLEGFIPDPNSKQHLPADLPTTTLTRAGEGSSRPPVWLWPGIEGVLESYQRHREEERMEAQILLDRCRRLHSENSELNKTAEALSKRMSTLLEVKHTHEVERQQLQSAIDSIKKCLHVYR